MVHDPTSRSYRVIALMGGFGGGDRPPAFALAAGLRDRGHQVSVLCDGDVAGLARFLGVVTCGAEPICRRCEISIKNE